MQGKIRTSGLDLWPLGVHFEAWIRRESGLRLGNQPAQ